MKKERKKSPNVPYVLTETMNIYVYMFNPRHCRYARIYYFSHPHVSFFQHNNIVAIAVRRISAEDKLFMNAARVNASKQSLKKNNIITECAHEQNEICPPDPLYGTYIILSQSLFWP